MTPAWGQMLSSKEEDGQAPLEVSFQQNLATYKDCERVCLVQPPCCSMVVGQCLGNLPTSKSGRSMKILCLSEGWQERPKEGSY
jgi:hypothetical protein